MGDVISGADSRTKFNEPNHIGIALRLLLRNLPFLLQIRRCAAQSMSN